MKLKVLKLAFLIHAFVWMPGSLFSQNSKIEEVFGNRTERYFSFEAKSKEEINALSRIISIDRVDGLTVTAVANTTEFENFLKHSIFYELLPSPNEGFEAVMLDSIDIKGIAEWDFYPTYPAYENMMYQFQTQYPSLCSIVSIGTLASGRKLLGARVSSNLVNPANKPQVLYSSSMHGDEITGYILSLRLINALLADYQSNPKIKRLVDSIDIWIFPLANPDGTYKGGNATVNGATRSNANNVDLNRNYPDPRAGQNPDGYAWQPETIAFMTLAQEQRFSLGANMHGGAEVCNYPWDTWTRLAADNTWWINVCRQYADTAQFYSPPGYLTYLGGITNGAAWYIITGGRQDYMNYYHFCREFTLELSNTKLLPAAQLPALWNYNYRSLLNYLEQALFGVRGVVTDAVSGLPVNARVYIQGFDIDNSHVNTHPQYGSYYRYLAPGTYNLTFSAPCYQSVNQTITISNRNTVIQNVQLAPLGLQAAFAASNASLNIGETVTFTDNTCGSVTSRLWTFAGGIPATSTVQNPQVTYNTQGAFDVSLTVGNGVTNHTTTLNAYITVGLKFLMSNGNITTCFGDFYDSGGASANYQNNENYILTFLPTVTGAKVQMNFTSFDIEANANCLYDYLRIYNGLSTAATLMGTFCGTNSPGIVKATNTAGALTFQFRSDASQTRPGWAASISCDMQGVGMLSLPEKISLSIYPNPAIEGNFTIESDDLITQIQVLNAIGRQVYFKTLNANKHLINIGHLDAGLYLVLAETTKGPVCRKFQIAR